MENVKHKYEVSTDSLTNDEITYYENINQGWTCTGEVLKEDFTDKYNLSYHSEYVVMKGFFTRYGMCRDCGDHYIIARWSRYDRIDKKTLKITYDVEDI